MVNNIIALLAVLIFVGLASALYYVLIRNVTKRVLNPFVACATLWLFIVVSPYIITFCAVWLGDYIYNSFPSLKVTAWDVGLAFSLWLAMYLSYAIGAIIALMLPWRFFEKIHTNKDKQ